MGRVVFGLPIVPTSKRIDMHDHSLSILYVLAWVCKCWTIQPLDSRTKTFFGMTFDPCSQMSCLHLPLVLFRVYVTVLLHATIIHLLGEISLTEHWLQVRPPFHHHFSASPPSLHQSSGAARAELRKNPHHHRPKASDSCACGACRPSRDLDE